MKHQTPPSSIMPHRSSFIPYPSYKPSGVEWLGDVPEHWEVKRLKDLLQYKKGAIKTGPFGSQLLSSEMYDEDVKVYNQKSVISNDFESGENYISFDKFKDLKEFQTFPGDFLITTRGTIGRCAILPKDAEQGILHPCLMRLQTNKTKVFDRYLEILIEESTFILEQLKIKSNGTTIEVIYQDSIKNVTVFLPSPLEQQAIAAFLDRETGRIDSLIAKKQRLLELLAEQRTALISRAVTKGLNAKVKLKPSGVEWLGDMPEHWGVKRLKDLLRAKKGAIKTGPFGSQLLSSEMYDEDIKVYNQKSVITNDFEYGENYISYEKFKDLKEFQTFPGDFLITTRGTIGRCAILPKDAELGILHPCLMRLQTNKAKVFDRFLEILIEESTFILEQLKIKSNGTTIEVIYQDSLKNVTVLLPPLPEQQAIAAFLDRETAKIDALCVKVTTIIDRLKEYRTALISSAVTGKIDVSAERHSSIREGV